MFTEKNPINWFEIPATDLERAKTFYEHIFSIAMTTTDLGTLKMAWFPGIPEGSGATGTLVQAEAYIPSYQGSMVYFGVDDIPAVLKKVEEKGGKVLNEKMSIGEYGFVAHFEDSEGNREIGRAHV